MKREIEQKLLNWKTKPHRMPLLLRGARQVGKTYIIEAFGEMYFEQMVSVNFELSPHLQACFETFEPEKIISMLSLLCQQQIIPGKTLLFLDEIQECPNAIMAMRYFKEKMPELHLIGAGSLLEFTLSEESFSMPVGRIEFLYLGPLSFKEFLNAMGEELLLERWQEFNLSNPLPDVIHQHLMDYVKKYSLLGGMPAVIAEYIRQKNFLVCQDIQSFLLNTYRNDFGKYATKTAYKHLQILYEKAPGLVAQWFKYVKVSQDITPKDMRHALTLLYNAGIFYPIYATTASGLPLVTTKNEKKFKLLFLDIGLLKKACQLDAELLLNDNLFLLNQGALAEQWVGQELIAHGDHKEPPALYFWTREEKSSLAEIDYLTIVDGNIIPIEVKAGSGGRLKSLQIFMAEKQSKVGVQVAASTLKYDSDRRILTLPLYWIDRIPEFVRLFL